MNENSKLVLPGMPNSGNPDLVKILETALAEARAGKLVGVAVVGVYGPEAMNCAAGGLHPLAIAAGCRKVAAQMEETLFGRRSQIVPARFG